MRNAESGNGIVLPVSLDLLQAVQDQERFAPSKLSARLSGQGMFAVVLGKGSERSRDPGLVENLVA
jgi:hypothetical protein